MAQDTDNGRRPQMTGKPADVRQLKQEIRNRARANRRKQPNKDELSRQVCRKLAALPEYANARTVMFYVDFGDEVRTQPFLPAAWKDGKRIVVPYCAGDQLELFQLQGLDELAPGTWNILEPRGELRGQSDRKVDLSELELIVVPGVAFDRRGGRLGHGRGYYDRLLRRVPADTPLVALAFQCQLFPEIPMLPHDVHVHKVITEKAVYERSGP